ncbi:MAG: PIN domain-containing protein [Candidatus Methanoperedenaceae archaeon]|nr:PIN domain-containing protein [Candidatus Methanoperedenaceae archaeon]
MKIFVDTSIFVDCLRSNPIASSKEFLENTLKIISTASIIDLNKEIAMLGGKIYSELAREGRAIELNDCLIAATSLSSGIKEIVTRNVDHFNKIKGLKVVIPEDLGF